MASPSQSTPNQTALETGNALTKGQVSGSHYKDLDISPWALQLALGPDIFVAGRICDLTKYFMRDKESRLEDFKKARHCIDAAISVMEQHPELFPSKQ